MDWLAFFLFLRWSDREFELLGGLAYILIRRLVGVVPARLVEEVGAHGLFQLPM